MADTIIAVLLAAVVAVLIAGIVLMGIGGRADRKYSNKLMMARVGLQGLVLLVLALLFMLGKN